MKHGHLTEQRKHFVEAYCRLGNGTLAAKEAGYKDSPSLVNQANELIRELSVEKVYQKLVSGLTQFEGLVNVRGAILIKDHTEKCLGFFGRVVTSMDIPGNEFRVSLERVAVTTTSRS